MKKHKKDIIYISVLILTFLVLSLYTVKETYLFGSNLDWYSQHVSFPEYFRTLFYNTKDLFPDFALNFGNGQNIYNFSYYGLLSPTILPSYLMPHVPMVYYIMISSVLIVLISACLMYYFLRKHSFNAEVSLISSLCFLLATPLVFHSHRHIMFINYMPFLIMGLFGVDKKMKEGKSWLLILSVFLMVMTSYYYSIGGILCLCIYALYLYLQKTKKVTCKTFFKTLFNIIGPVLIAVCLSSIITIPTILAILNNRLESNVSISIWSLIKPVPSNFKNLLYNTYSMGLPTIVIPALINFFKKDKTRITIGIILVAVFLFDIFNFILNGTMYIDAKSLIPLLPLYICVIAIFFRDLFENKINYKILIPTTIVLSLYICLSGYLRLHYIVEIVFIFGLLFVYYKKPNKWLIIVPLFFLLLGNAYLHNLKDTLELRIETRENDEAITDSLNIITSQDDGIYRTSLDVNKATYPNKIFDNIKYNNSTLYSSISNSNYNVFYYDILANNMSHRNRALTTTTTNPITLMLFGNKYVITYNKPLQGYELLANNDGLKIYRNNNVLPLGFATSNIMSYEDYEKLNFFAEQEALLNVIVTDKQSNNTFVPNVSKANIDFTKVLASDNTKVNEDGTITIKTTKDFRLKYNLPQGYYNKVLFIRFKLNNEAEKDDQTIVINGIKNKLTQKDWKYYNGNKTFDYVLGFQDQKNLNIVVSKGEYNLSDFEVYVIDYIFLEQGVKSADKMIVDNIKTKGDRISGIVNVTNDGYFMTTIPYQNGFEIKVDGVKTPYEKVDYSFIGFPITEGHHEIDMIYKAPGKSIATIVTVLGLISYIAVIVIEDKRKI